MRALWQILTVLRDSGSSAQCQIHVNSQSTLDAKQILPWTQITSVSFGDASLITEFNRNETDTGGGGCLRCRQSLMRLWCRYHWKSPFATWCLSGCLSGQNVTAVLEGLQSSLLLCKDCFSKLHSPKLRFNVALFWICLFERFEKPPDSYDGGTTLLASYFQMSRLMGRFVTFHWAFICCFYWMLYLKFLFFYTSEPGI